MIWGTLYALCLAVLVVRVRTGDEGPPEPLWPAVDEPLWLTRLHHALFAVLLLGAPLERLVLPGASRGRAIGATLLIAGVLLYRVAGRTLGPALSPFIAPRATAGLVTEGLYAWVRHPMYLSEALIAVGAPLTLGSRVVLLLAVPALIVLGIRVLLEEDALARTFPEYSRYAATTKRLLPFLY